jgi:acyl-coenzyme A thioesterase PaaI-like protein
MNHPADTELTGMLHHAMPFTRTLGMEAIAANADEVRVRGTWSAERCTAAGILHGGYLMALADAAGATLASFNLRPRTHTSTIESSPPPSCTADKPPSSCRPTHIVRTASW